MGKTHISEKFVARPGEVADTFSYMYIYTYTHTDVYIYMYVCESVYDCIS